MSEARPAGHGLGPGLQVLTDRELRAIRHHWRRHRGHRLAEERLIAISDELERRRSSKSAETGRKPEDDWGEALEAGGGMLTDELPDSGKGGR
jgi:hypothetical protein